MSGNRTLGMGDRHAGHLRLAVVLANARRALRRRAGGLAAGRVGAASATGAASGPGIATEVGGRSSRRPMNDPWRTRPCGVSSVYSISATSIGFTQWIACAREASRGTDANGGRCGGEPPSRAVSDRSVASSKPVPTRPR